MVCHCGEYEGILSLILNSSILERGHRSPGLQFPEEIHLLPPFILAVSVLRQAAQPFPTVIQG
jgi:hypothetical protein